MRNIVKRPEPSKALLVTGLLLAVVGGVALARQNRRNGLAKAAKLAA